MRLVFPGGVAVQAFGRSGVVSIEGDVQPDWALYLDELWRDVEEVVWSHRFVEWPDFELPTDESDAFDAFEEAWRRAKHGEIVDIACDGGTGRTGTTLACLGIMAGIPLDEVVPWVRSNYHRWAVEVPEQEAMIERFGNHIEEPR